MFEKPRLDDTTISACLTAHYGLAVTGIHFLLLGYDFNAGVYRVDADGQAYFLKVKRDTVDELSVLLPHYLKRQGIEQVVAPLPTLTQEFWCKVDPFTLILYPFVEGQSGWDAGLSDSQWIEFGRVLKHLHTIQLPPDLLARVPQETFVPPPKWAALVQRLHAAVGSQVYDHPVEQQLAAFWKNHRHEIDTIVNRSGQLGHMLQDQPLDCVVCHADSHVANVLIDGQGRLFVVDWDQPVMAPKERDLMFVTAGGFTADERTETLFFRGYGPTDLHPLALAYYRYERAMEDIASFAEQVLLLDSSEATKRDSFKWFLCQFEPDSVLEAARKLEDTILKY